MRRSRRACLKRPRASSKSNFAARRRPHGTRRSRSSRSSTAAGTWAASISTCTPARARTSGSPPRPSSPACAGAHLPEAALICNFPGGDGRRSRPAAILRRGHFLPRVRPPDARHPGRPDRVGGHLRLCHRGRLHRGALADAGRVLPRREAAPGLCQALPDRRDASLRDHQEDEAGRGLRPRRLGAFAALLHHALARPARPEPRRPRPRQHHQSGSTRACSPGPGWKATACTRASAISPATRRTTTPTPSTRSSRWTSLPSSIPATCWAARPAAAIARLVLEQGGSKPGRADGARLPGPRRGVCGLHQWLNEEFEATGNRE